jgi:hypothetical protein
MSSGQKMGARSVQVGNDKAVPWTYAPTRQPRCPRYKTDTVVR